MRLERKSWAKKHGQQQLLEHLGRPWPTLLQPTWPRSAPSAPPRARTSSIPVRASGAERQPSDRPSPAEAARRSWLRHGCPPSREVLSAPGPKEVQLRPDGANSQPRMALTPQCRRPPTPNLHVISQPTERALRDSRAVKASVWGDPRGCRRYLNVSEQPAGETTPARCGPCFADQSPAGS